MASKLDLSLDDIIALNRREASAQKKALGRGKGRGRGRRVSGQGGGSGGGGKPGGLAQRRWRTKGKAAQDTVANARAQSRQKAQQLRQKARQTIFNKRRNQQQQQQQRTNSTPKQQQPSTSVTGIKQRLGIAPVRGRGGRGRGRGRSQAQSLDVGGASGSRPGSQLKNIRNAKAQARGRGRGGSPGGALARQALSQLTQDSPDGGSRRGCGKGRGRGLRRPESSPSGSTKNIQMTVVQDPEEFEPIGVELPHDFAIQHHTTKSLNARFTPKAELKSPQRFVHQGDRAVNFQS